MQKKEKNNKILMIIIILLLVLVLSVLLSIFIKGYQKDIRVDFISFDQEKDVILDDFFNAKYSEELDEAKYSNIWGLENVKTLDDGSYMVNYPAGSYKPSATPRGGAGFIYKLDTPREKAKLSYQIKFDKNFQFVKGGKLPGFCGGDCPRGGKEDNIGFSTRYMWRAGGKIELYTYLPNDNTPLGKGFGKGSFIFEKDKFYTISQELIMNNIGESNGVLTLMVDGERIYKNEKIMFRKNESTKIDSILFSTFFGGGDDSFATPVDTFIIIKDFEISY